MRMRRCLMGMMLAAALAQVGCSERPQNYVPGQSTAAADPPPYASSPFNGNRGAWERAVADRAKGQNDYLRAQ